MATNQWRDVFDELKENVRTNLEKYKVAGANAKLENLKSEMTIDAINSVGYISPGTMAGGYGTPGTYTTSSTINTAGTPLTFYPNSCYPSVTTPMRNWPMSSPSLVEVQLQESVISLTENNLDLQNRINELEKMIPELFEMIEIVQEKISKI